MTQQLPPYASPEPVPTAQTSYGAPARGTNLMAVLSIVFAFVFSPLGIVFGIVGRKQIARTGEGGKGLATAGLILSTIFLVLGIAAAVIVGVMATSIAGGASADAVAAQMQQQSAGRATGVSCPGGLAPQVGAEVVCTATVDGAPAQLKGTVTSAANGTVAFDIVQIS